MVLPTIHTSVQFEPFLDYFLLQNTLFNELGFKESFKPDTLTNSAMIILSPGETLVHY